MASSASTKQGSQRRLAELLNEQQEPFVLELYLLERGYRVPNNSGLEGTIFGCCFTKNDDSKNLKKSSMKSSTQLSNMAKSLLSKLVLRKKPRKRREEEIVGSNARCSSFSCSTTLSNNTWSESDTEGEIISTSSSTTKKTTHHNESAQRRFVEEDKQCSPDSVLDEIDLLQGIPLYNVRQPQEEKNCAESRTGFQTKVTGDAILSASLWELLMQFTGDKPNHQGRREAFPEYMKALQKDRQLVFDCVREAVENGNQLKSCFRNSREKGLKLRCEETGKVVCKNSKAWRKLSADEPNIKRLIKGDLHEGGAANEWSSFEVWKNDIVAEIENDIFDEVTEQIIRDMID